VLYVSGKTLHFPSKIGCFAYLIFSLYGFKIYIQRQIENHVSDITHLRRDMSCLAWRVYFIYISCELKFWLGRLHLGALLFPRRIWDESEEVLFDLKRNQPLKLQRWKEAAPSASWEYLEKRQKIQMQNHGKQRLFGKTRSSRFFSEVGLGPKVYYVQTA